MWTDKEGIVTIKEGIVTMRNDALKAPRLSPVELHDLEDAQHIGLGSGEHREGERHSGASLDWLDLTGISFTECELSALSVHEAQLRGARFSQCRISDLYAPVFACSRSSWRDVVLRNTRWGSAELYGSEWESVHLQGGKLGFLNLRGATRTDVIISDCIIDDLDLSGTKATRLGLKNCRIGTVDLGEAMLKDVDLRGSEFATVNGLQGARGVTIDSYQLALFAPLLAAGLGIRVQD